MKRRSLGLMAGASLAAMKYKLAKAAAPDPSLLKTTLTPMGGIRAGNAAGTIPAWSGGYTTIPDGWQPGQSMPDFFASDQPVAVINASNMAQHADNLSDGVMAMMTKFGFNIKVYPSRRTAAAPQSVYDNIAANCGRATLDPAGPRFGFLNAFGGIPFPIPDTSDPYVAGAQIMWNHETRWGGYGYDYTSQAWSVNSGQLEVAEIGKNSEEFTYYKKQWTLANFNGIVSKILAPFVAPANDVGEIIIVWDSTNTRVRPKVSWELLNGQGRVRKTPELSYDTPSAETNGISNFDEYDCLIGQLDRYDWKYLGQKEMYIPYNNNAMYLQTPQTMHLTHFLNPDFVRWELHRVWVVEATLHPGSRNVLARRRFYVDEDTFVIGTTDAYDANNNLYHVDTNYTWLRPEGPGLIHQNNTVNNMQTGDYCTNDGCWNEKASPSFIFRDNYQPSIFDPQMMAASGQY